MGNYYLIARNTIDNSFKVIGLKSKWYLKNGNDYTSRSNSLEAIDLVTTRFKSSEDMAKRLYDRHYIDNPNCDFFIVSKYKRNNVEKLKFQEVIYNVKEDRTNDFRDIAYNSLNKNIRCEKNIRLFDKFITKSFYSESYNRIVQDGLTGLPYKFSKDFSKIREYKTVPYKLKYDNAWCMGNYGISRNVVDSLNRFDVLSGSDVYKKHIDYFDSLVKERMKIYGSLMEVCDKNYFPQQLSIFDVKEKELSISDKKNFVIKYLMNIGLDSFSRDDNGKMSINVTNLVDYMDKDELKILSKKLNVSINTAAYLCNLHKAKMNSIGTSYGNLSCLQEDLDMDVTDLKKALKSDKTIEKTYEYCVTLDRVKKKVKSEDVMTYQKGGSKK